MNIKLLQWTCSDNEAQSCTEIIKESIASSFGIEHPVIEKYIKKLDRFMPLDRNRVLASVEGKIVGFIDWEENKIEYLFVQPKYWENGIGTQLLAFSEKEIGGDVEVVCLQDNERAIKFYEKNGYKIIGDNYARFFGENVINHLMRKNRLDL